MSPYLPIHASVTYVFGGVPKIVALAWNWQEKDVDMSKLKGKQSSSDKETRCPKTRMWKSEKDRSIEKILVSLIG